MVDAFSFSDSLIVPAWFKHYSSITSTIVVPPEASNLSHCIAVIHTVAIAQYRVVFDV